MKTINDFKKIMNVYDKELVGTNIGDIQDLNMVQKFSIWNNIQISLPLNLLDENEYIYVVSFEGRQYIIPAIYKEYLSEYCLGKAYFSDMLPIFSIINIQRDNKNGLIYFIETQDNVQSLFLNDNAVSMLKTMNPEEISYFIKANCTEKVRK